MSIFNRKFGFIEQKMYFWTLQRVPSKKNCYSTFLPWNERLCWPFQSCPLNAYVSVTPRFALPLKADVFRLSVLFKLFYITAKNEIINSILFSFSWGFQNGVILFCTYWSLELIVKKKIKISKLLWLLFQYAAIGPEHSNFILFCFYTFIVFCYVVTFAA